MFILYISYFCYIQGIDTICINKQKSILDICGLVVCGTLTGRVAAKEPPFWLLIFFLFYLKSPIAQLTFQFPESSLSNLTCGKRKTRKCKHPNRQYYCQAVQTCNFLQMFLIALFTFPGESKHLKSAQQRSTQPGLSGCKCPTALCRLLQQGTFGDIVSLSSSKCFDWMG